MKRLMVAPLQWPDVIQIKQAMMAYAHTGAALHRSGWSVTPSAQRIMWTDPVYNVLPVEKKKKKVSIYCIIKKIIVTQQITVFFFLS